MLEIIVDPLLPIIIIVAGIIGLAYGINKLMRSKEDESDLLKYLALATSIVVGVVNLIAIFEAAIDTTPPDVTVHWLTILVIFLAGTSMLAEPLKNTPLAAVIAVIAFGALAGLFLLFAAIDGDIYNVDIVGIVEFPLWLIILTIVIIVGLIFLVTLFTEFTIDRILQLISWAPAVIILSVILLIQGILILIIPDPAGIWYFFTT
ncbi:MAG: hypothetical protein ACFFDT_35450 [Candidatus Hodarchaeota archaeon]